MPTFEESLAKIEAKEKRAEQRKRDAPRNHFHRDGEKAGFSKTQLKFMWEWLAKADHSHWDGRVGY